MLRDFLIDGGRSASIMQSKVRLNSGRCLLALTAAAVAYAPSAYAYIDPGTGSLIVQGLIAGVAVFFGAVSMYWQRLKHFVSSMLSRAKGTKSAEESSKDGETDVESGPH